MYYAVYCIVSGNETNEYLTAYSRQIGFDYAISGSVVSSKTPQIQARVTRAKR